MLENKIMNIIKTTVVATAAAAILSSCDGGSCLEPAYGVKSAVEIKSSENTYVLGAASIPGNYATASCPSGCSYDEEVGCCWCPD